MSVTLPYCAMSFDGAYLENQLTWYRTLAVEGREVLDTDIEVIERSGDGALYRHRREKPRKLKVVFAVKADTHALLMVQIDNLKKHINKEQVQVIFSDESDRYYIGTLKKLEFTEQSKTMAVGEAEIYCADPHKYSTTVTEVTASNGEFALNYDGTYKCYPELEATANSDLGYVSYIDADQHVIQIGDPDEDDMELNDHKTTLINDSFVGSSLPSGWVTQSTTPATLESDVASYVQQGSVSVTSNGLKANSFGSNTTTRHGPSITRVLPNGTTAKNFDLSFNLKMYATSVKQIQEVMVICTGTVNSTKTVICSMHFTKSGDGSYNANVYNYVMGQNKNAMKWTASQGNKWFGSGGQCRIRKNGDVFTFEANKATTFETRVAGTEDYAISEVSIFFDKKKTLDAMNTCLIKNVQLNVYTEEWDDVPNKFSSGDVIIADCSSGQITVNGAAQYGLGALGNDWETFYLTNGVNTIKCVYSDWATTAPTFKLRYRKVYL